MFNKTETGRHLLEIKKVSGDKSVETYLNQIDTKHLGLVNPASAIPRPKEEIMAPIEEDDEDGCNAGHHRRP